MLKIASFSNVSPFSPIQAPKMHKITSLENDMRKFLRPKFWSLGTSLGYLGPVSQWDVPLGFYKLQFLVIWGPYEPSVIVAPLVFAKRLKTVPACCEDQLATFWTRIQLRKSQRDI